MQTNFKWIFMYKQLLHNHLKQEGQSLYFLQTNFHDLRIQGGHVAATIIYNHSFKFFCAITLLLLESVMYYGDLQWILVHLLVYKMYLQLLLNGILLPLLLLSSFEQQVNEIGLEVYNEVVLFVDWPSIYNVWINGYMNK